MIEKKTNLPQYTIRLTEDITGTEKNIILEMGEESRFTDFLKALKDVTLSHIGLSFVYANFSSCTLSFRYFTEDIFTYHFNDIEDMKRWFYYFFQEECVGNG